MGERATDAIVIGSGVAGGGAAWRLAKEGHSVRLLEQFAIGTGKLRVDDYLYDALDNTYAVGTSFSNVVGICGFSFSNRKIWPRDAADLQ